MPGRSRLARIICLALLFVWFGAVQAAPAQSHAGVAAHDSERLSAVQEGRRLELTSRWPDAIDHYEKSLKKWPDDRELEYALRRSKVHFSIDRRYSDKSFTSELLGKSEREALDLLDDVLHQVRSRYVEPISSTSFVSHGTESLYMALSNPKFKRWHLGDTDNGQIARMRALLTEQYWNKPVADRGLVRRLIGEICDTAGSLLHIPRSAIIMEYVFGGCNALDDYSGYLTPDRLDDLYGNIDGEFVGLGIEIKAEAGKGVQLINVLPDGPAADGGLLPGDYIVRIDGTDCVQMSTNEAAGLLRGPVGSRVSLVINDEKQRNSRSRVLIRRPVHVKSITDARIVDQANGIGYIRMTGFQKTSPTELDAAMKSLLRQGMRSLIWDLRDNPGGLLPAAVEVLDRFIDHGVLVSTRGRTADQNYTYSAYRVGTYKLPLVLLVDGNSASASEIVAGAIRDHRRGLVVGRKTYGKWSVQTILQSYPSLSASPGLRLTTARFYSPNGNTLDKVGLQPDIPVDASDEHLAFRNPSETDLTRDTDVREGIRVLRRQLSSR